ncbi:MAG: hypothetical protein MJK04_33810, partial [Psychrosphaera sp.]|nr:hypothetical protein [Psychrosphaera sp.]
LSAVGAVFSGDVILASTLTSTSNSGFDTDWGTSLVGLLADMGRRYVVKWFFPSGLAISGDKSGDKTQPLAKDNIPDFTVVKYRQFEFVKIKQRTYQQLVASAGSPVNLNKVFDIYQQFFHGYQVDYQNFAFTIYEDDRFGLNIAIPAQTKLVVDDNDFLVVQGKMFCRTCSYEIQYHARELAAKEQQQVLKKPNDFLNQVAEDHWQDLNEEGDFGEYLDFRDIESFGGNRYVLRAAFADFDEPFKAQYELNYFIAATNRDAWFQAQGILNRFDAAFFAALDKYRGTDCRQLSRKVIPDKQRVAVCRDIETMLKVLISVHLTSFSNKFYDHKHSKPD